MDATERFSDRVADYVSYRPSYPDAVFEAIERRATEQHLTSRSAADVGSGTGIFSRALLEHGWQVHAIEPNAEMRSAAERDLAGHPGFASHATRAEATELPEQSVALITGAQSFHWFDKAQCQTEWRRILIPRGLVCLIWNIRQLGTPFMDAYEATLLDLVPEYPLVTYQHSDEVAVQHFFQHQCTTESFPNQQTFDWPAFLGRVTSSSYIPKPGAPLHDILVARLKAVFDEHQIDGRVQFLYETRATFGNL